MKKLIKEKRIKQIIIRKKAAKLYFTATFLSYNIKRVTYTKYKIFESSVHREVLAFGIFYCTYLIIFDPK